MHKRLSENIEFSFGKGIGGKIYNAINNAKHSVFVLTPYISKGYIDFLLRKKQEGINISLVITDAQKERMDDIFRKIVLQNRVVDEKKLIFKKKAKRWCLLLGLGTLLTGLANFPWHKFGNNVHSILKELTLLWNDNSTLIIIPLGMLFALCVLYNIFHRIKVFSYFYNTKFPFVVFPAVRFHNMRLITPILESFVHAKVYVIDNKDIFIGSVNLTKSGLRHNIESFIKISDHEIVKEIAVEIDSYLDAHCRPININSLGASLYHEALY